MARTMPQWAELVGVKEKEINELAQEFTSHGRKGRGRYPPGRLPAHLRVLQRPGLDDPECADRQPRLEGRAGQSDHL